RAACRTHRSATRHNTRPGRSSSPRSERHRGPAGAGRRSPIGAHLARIGDRVPDIGRFEPFKLAKARGKAEPHRRLAARTPLRLLLTVAVHGEPATRHG